MVTAKMKGSLSNEKFLLFASHYADKFIYPVGVLQRLLPPFFCCYQNPSCLPFHHGLNTSSSYSRNLAGPHWDCRGIWPCGLRCHLVLSLCSVKTTIVGLCGLYHVSQSHKSLGGNGKEKCNLITVSKINNNNKNHLKKTPFSLFLQRALINIQSYSTWASRTKQQGLGDLQTTASHFFQFWTHM